MRGRGRKGIDDCYKFLSIQTFFSVSWRISCLFLRTYTSEHNCCSLFLFPPFTCVCVCFGGGLITMGGGWEGRRRKRGHIGAPALEEEGLGLARGGGACAIHGRRRRYSILVGVLPTKTSKAFTRFIARPCMRTPRTFVLFWRATGI